MEQRKDSVINVLAQNKVQAPPVIVDFSSGFLKTEPKKITEIEVHNTDLQIQLLDYMKPIMILFQFTSTGKFLRKIFKFQKDLL